MINHTRSILLSLLVLFSAYQPSFSKGRPMPTVAKVGLTSGTLLGLAAAAGWFYVTHKKDKAAAQYRELAKKLIKAHKKSRISAHGAVSVGSAEELLGSEPLKSPMLSSLTSSDLVALGNVQDRMAWWQKVWAAVGVVAAGSLVVGGTSLYLDSKKAEKEHEEALAQKVAEEKFSASVQAYVATSEKLYLMGSREYAHESVKEFFRLVRSLEQAKKASEKGEVPLGEDKLKVTASNLADLLIKQGAKVPAFEVIARTSILDADAFVTAFEEHSRGTSYEGRSAEARALAQEILEKRMDNTPDMKQLREAEKGCFFGAEVPSIDRKLRARYKVAKAYKEKGDQAGFLVAMNGGVPLEPGSYKKLQTLFNEGSPEFFAEMLYDEVVKTANNPLYIEKNQKVEKIKEERIAVDILKARIGRLLVQNFKRSDERGAILLRDGNTDDVDGLVQRVLAAGTKEQEMYPSLLSANSMQESLVAHKKEICAWLANQISSKNVDKKLEKELDGQGAASMIGKLQNGKTDRTYDELLPYALLQNINTARQGSVYSFLTTEYGLPMQDGVKREWGDGRNILKGIFDWIPVEKVKKHLLSPYEEATNDYAQYLGKEEARKELYNKHYALLEGHCDALRNGCSDGVVQVKNEKTGVVEEKGITYLDARLAIALHPELSNDLSKVYRLVGKFNDEYRKVLETGHVSSEFNKAKEALLSVLENKKYADTRSSNSSLDWKKFARERVAKIFPGLEARKLEMMLSEVKEEDVLTSYAKMRNAQENLRVTGFYVFSDEKEKKDARRPLVNGRAAQMNNAFDSTYEKFKRLHWKADEVNGVASRAFKKVLSDYYDIAPQYYSDKDALISQQYESEFQKLFDSVQRISTEIDKAYSTETAPS